MNTSHSTETSHENSLAQLRRMKTESSSGMDGEEEEVARVTHTLSRVPTSHHDDALHRALTGRETVFSTSLPEMGDGKPYPPSLPDRTPYRVEFTGDNDPISPLNWPLKRKLMGSFALAYTTMNAAFASSIYGSISEEMKPLWHIGTTPSQLGTFAFVLGFALGPCIWGPLSEYLGRKSPLVAANLIMTCFSFGSATAKDFQTLILCRFFAGVAGASSFTIVPGAFADVYDSHHRGVAASIFSFCVSGGTMLSPVVGGFIAHSYLGWRWCLYISSIMTSLALVLLVFCYQETYHPMILKKKARELRERTGNWGIYAQHETIALDFNEIATKSLVRPIKMLIQEPILFLVSLYGGFVYGLLYMSLGALPYMYQSGYGWNSGVIGLPYVALFIGSLANMIMCIVYFEPRYNRKLDESGLPVVPEQRLVQMMVGAPLFTIGIFWIFWTGAYPKTAEHPHGCHYMVPIVGGTLFGYGFVSIFMSMINYVLDTYLMLAASGMAANTFLRSIMGAVFPLFAVQMFRNLGVQWAGTLVGCLSILLVPIPFLFFKYGKFIRQKSKFAMDLSGPKGNSPEKA